MLRQCLRLLCKGSPSPITDEAATESVGTRFQRRMSRSARFAQQRARKKQLSRARGQLIREKTAAMREELGSITDARDVLMVPLADQIFSRGHEFHSSACNVSYVPDGNPATPEVALVGRSASGKTCLMRSLFREKRAVGRSNSAARKDAINFFSVGGGVFNIAETPGLGGTSVPWSALLQAAVLIRNFVRCRPNLKMLYYCMDVNPRHGVYIQDLDLLKFLSSEAPNFTILLTKADLLADTPCPRRNGEPAMETARFTVVDVKKELLRNEIEHPVLVTSAYTLGGVDVLRYDMVWNAMHSLPTERLSLTEARRLSDRVLTQAEIGSVRHLSLPPTDTQFDVEVWNRSVEAERHQATDPSNSGDSVASSSSPTVTQQPPSDVGAIAVATKPAAAVDAYRSLIGKMSNDRLMRYVHETSPWRNPALWPSNVVPTKHPRRNIVRCPEDPDNPYLTQAHFVAPRMDMYFRRLNVGARRSPQKGRYESESSPASVLGSGKYTIPYFPDIVDVNMCPMPWMFLGSKQAYYQTSGGRSLGIRLARRALSGVINPLQDNPAPDIPLLAAELRRLEEPEDAGSSAAAAAPGGGETKQVSALQESRLPEIAHLRPS